MRSLSTFEKCTLGCTIIIAIFSGVWKIYEHNDKKNKQTVNKSEPSNSQVINGSGNIQIQGSGNTVGSSDNTNNQ